MRKKSILAALLFCAAASVFGQYPGQFDDKMKVKVSVPVKAFAFSIEQVRLLDGPFKNAMKLDQEWLKSLDNDRLLHNYRVNAGLKTSAKAYGGWEELDCELRGHSLGHILSALSLMYASTGDTVYLNKGNSLVAGLADCQQALNRGGYLSAFPEKFIDRVIDRNPVWAPWYTLHKMYAGLIDMYLYCNNQQAFEIVKKMGDWAYNKLQPLSDKQMQEMLRTEFGGMNESMYNLYAITGDVRYKQLAEKFYHHSVLDPLAEQKDKLEGLHANTQIPKVIGEIRGYELTGNDREKQVPEFFWQTVLKNHTYVIGGNSDGEAFGPAGKLSGRLSDYTTETCNTYNMLKLNRHLFCLEPDAKLADYYERALYNHILASQNPEDGNVCYYVTLRPGGQKAFSEKFNSFWCCVGTGFENHAKYGEAIYYKSADNGLYVNLFIASELNWAEKGLKITQQTDYPEKPSTTLTFSTEKAIKMPLYIRCPQWSKGGIAIKLNSRFLSIKSEPGSFVKIDRKWTNGDKLEIEFHMSLYTESMPDNAKKIAILYGPVVLCGELGKETIDPVYGIPVLVADNKPVNQWVKPVEDKSLTFKTNGVGMPNDAELIPFYKVYNQHGVVYWDLFTQADWQSKKAEYAAAKQREAELEMKTIDYVGVGEPQSEHDHQFESYLSESDIFNGRKYRNTHDGGWMSFQVKVDPTKPVDLFMTFWGNDGKQNFDIYIDGKKMEPLSYERKANEFFNVIVPVPHEFTGTADKVTILFKANATNWMNGLYGLRILKK
jgi:uncharacterized protein